MKVIKVVVDEVPEGCTNCDFDDFMADNALGECMILAKEFEPGNSFLRPDWCPLVTKQHYIDELFAELEKLIPLTSNKKYKFVSGEYNENSGTIPSVESEE